jgi:uncharacterized cupredoxin-like copper-binding protein
MYARRVVLLAMVLLLAQGCASGSRPRTTDSKSEPETIAVRATEYAYSMPKRVTGGVVTFEMVNAGREPHVFTLVPLGRHTEKELLAALKRGGPPSWASGAIGVAPIGPGRTVKTMLKIDQPGTYALVCSLPSPKGPPHVLLGMIGSFEVSGASEATFPKPDATIVATEKGLEVPSLTPGVHTVEFRNAGKQEHEFFLYALQPGKTSKDVDAWFESGQQGPAPVTFVGGLEAVPPGTSRFQQLHLEEGLNYTLEDVVGGHTVRFTAS